MSKAHIMPISWCKNSIERSHSKEKMVEGSRKWRMRMLKSKQ